MHAARPQAGWRAGPSAPLLDDGGLHVWFVDLAQTPATLLGLLSRAERERAARILDPARSRRWAMARAVLRDLLGRYTRRDPRALRLTADAAGKPHLGRGRGERGLQFSIAHSGHLAVYAFATAGALGADVEDGSKPADCIALARRALGSEASKRLSHSSAAAVRKEFLRDWTRREADFKCLGGSTADFVDRQSAHRDPWRMQLERLPGAPHGAAAVTTLPAPLEVRLWVYRERPFGNAAEPADSVDAHRTCPSSSITIAQTWGSWREA